MPCCSRQDAFTPAVVQRTLIPAGSAYLAHARRELQNLSFDAYDKLIEQDRLRIEALRGDGLNGEDDLGVGDEQESPELSLLDPKEWKVCRCLPFFSLGARVYLALDFLSVFRLPLPVQ